MLIFRSITLTGSGELFFTPSHLILNEWKAEACSDHVNRGIEDQLTLKNKQTAVSFFLQMRLKWQTQNKQNMMDKRWKVCISLID